MFKIKVFVILTIFLAITGCATVQNTKVKSIDDSPNISKTVAQESSDETTKGLKRKVAIARFTNETKYGQSFFLDDDQDKIGKQAVDILSNKLLATDKFILLERDALKKILEELSIGDVTPLKNMADYLIVGSITEFGRKTTGEVGVFSRTKKQEAYAKVHIRLIDVYTTQVIYSEEGGGTAFSEAGTVLGVGGRAGYDSSLNDKALDSAISNLSSNIIENLLDKPWRAYILGYEDGNLIISGGESQNIKIGDEFNVMLEGKKVNNPQTNMLITLPGKKIAKIKVLVCTGDVAENEVSFCEIIEGDLSDNIQNKDFTQVYIQEINEGG